MHPVFCGILWLTKGVVWIRYIPHDKRSWDYDAGRNLKGIFKKTVLTVVIAYLLFTWGKILFLKDGQIEYFYVALFCGIPFGIQRMFLWLIPSGRSSISFTIGIIAVNFIVDGMVGIVVLAWKLLVAAWYVPLTIYRLLTL